MKNKNIKKFLFLFLILFLAGFFGFGKKSHASNTLIINEILLAGEKSTEEFVEIYNPTGSDINLKTLSLKIHIVSSTNSDTSKTLSFINEIIPAKGFFLITSVDYGKNSNNLAISDATYSTSGNSLVKNGAFYISTSREKNENVIDFVGFGTNAYFSTNITANPMDNKSAERTAFTKNVWQESYEPGGTPGKENSKPKEYAKTVRINEFYPKPENDALQNEFVELYNAGDKAVDLKNWRLEDRGGYKCALPNKEILPRKFIVVTKGENDECTIALNDTQGEFIGLYNPQDVQPVSTAEYPGSAKEGKSYNFDGIDWHWSQFLTQGEKNKFNNLPEVSKKKDNKIYVGVYADFSAKGHDADKDKLKFAWDFGDGGPKSYKKETRHKFKKAGKYKVTLKVSDGSEDKLETFNIKVEKFPKSKVKIVSVSPNPKGKDSDSEFITLQNKSKKKINLKDWSVATGSKNLYNHPISEDIVIKPGETITLTRTFSRFALNNKKAKIELRYPDGKVASKLAYDKKKKSVAEDEIYTKESGRWAWVVPKTETRLAIAEKVNPIGGSPRVEEEPIVLAMSGKNFSEDKTFQKNALADLARPHGIVLGAATFKPVVFGAYLVQDNASFLEIIFTQVNPIFNYFINKFFLKLGL